MEHKIISTISQWEINLTNVQQLIMTMNQINIAAKYYSDNLKMGKLFLRHIFNNLDFT